MKQRTFATIMLILVMGVFFVFQKHIFPDNKTVPQIERNNLAKTPPSTVTLKELAAARGIRIGGNYDYELRSETHDKIFEQEYNAMTVGFFREVIYPSGSSDLVFSETDERVSWATTLGMEVFGQTLVWFEDIPAWVKSTPVGQVEAAMFKHIDTLVSRYAGRVKLWNVVNEAIDDEGKTRLNHRWAEAMGDDYISKAMAEHGYVVCLVREAMRRKLSGTRLVTCQSRRQTNLDSIAI